MAGARRSVKDRLIIIGKLVIYKCGSCGEITTYDDESKVTKLTCKGCGVNRGIKT